MIVTRGYVREEFARLLAINDICYTGVQRPSPAEFQGMLANSTVFAARSQTVDRTPILGFAIVRPENIPYLWSIAVLPAYWGRGFGSTLLREVISVYPEMYLHVKPDNPAQKLYFDFGFRVSYIAKRWYKNEGDALYMRRGL